MLFCITHSEGLSSEIFGASGQEQGAEAPDAGSQQEGGALCGSMQRGDPRRRRKGARRVSELETALGDYLNAWPWDLFGHLTFGGWAPKDDYAHREFVRHFLFPVNEQLYGKRWREKNEGVLVVRAWEYGGRGGRGHFHFLASSGLTRELAGIRRDALWGRWFGEVGRARFEPYDLSKGARYYLGKEYLAKGGELDYIGPTWKWEAARGGGQLVIS